MKTLRSFAYAILMVLLLGTGFAYAADTENPSDVNKVTAVAMDKAVKVSWTKATDDVGIKGYQVHYGTTKVSKSGESYEQVKDVGNVTEYKVTGLENGTTYYFSIIAYDAAGNESLAWAPEASATPKAGAGGDATDKNAPQVAKAEAVYKDTVKVVFSEAIVLPEEDADEAFTIENEDTLELLAVTKAEMDTEDKDNKTVLLTTAAQTDKISYKLTVGVDIEDLAGNPIISGTSDTAVFTGTAAVKTDDSSSPEVVSVEVVDTEHFLVTFNETVVLGIDPASHFKVTAADGSELTVLEVTLGENDEGVEMASALVRTDAQKATEYTVKVSGLTDESGNAISSTKNTGTFQGGGASGDSEDTVAPKDVAKLIAKKFVEGQKYLVTLTWDVPKENLNDLVSQILYQSTNGTDFSKLVTLEADDEEYTVKDLEPGEYWFKLTQMDKAGNESTGTLTKVVLAETGPEMLGLLLFSIGAGHLVSRRKKV